jgi:WD40 repeat protein
MSNLCTIGVALWPGLPKPQVTAMVMCRQSLCIATGTADGSIWLWRIPSEWRHSCPKLGSQRRALRVEDLGSVGSQGSSSIRPLAVLCGHHEAPITSLVTAFEGKHHVLVSADTSGCMCVWRVEDGVCLKTFCVLAWGPRTMVSVSCKGKTLIACCGRSPDIEVIDLESMKRIVRLFGHGDWCTDLCVRPQEAYMEHDIHSLREPSIYSLDQGGTLCVWLAERTSSPNMVGWVPSVQCHRVPVACPTGTP